MKHKQLFKTTFFFVVSILLLGCNKINEKEVEVVVQPETEVFTLTATYGRPDTKVAFDDDGLNMSWQPGDKLYLVDVTGKNSTVVMSTSITETSKTASFKSTSSVLSGDYIVLYGQSVLTVDKSIDMTSVSNLNSQICLYGTLTVEDGQTSASISLSQLYTMLTFKFKNLPGLSDMKLGMCATEGGTPTFNSGNITQSGLIPSSSDQQLIYFNWNSGAEGKSLIAPTDFTGKTLYFFIYGTDADGKHVTYEFVKSGKNLLAGVNYNLTFDFTQASSTCSLGKSSIYSSAYILNSPESFRAASYWNQPNNYYSVEADIDFAGEVYFPINAYQLYGNKHTLTNISVDLRNCSNVGILSSGRVLNLTVKNSSFIGNDYVGAMAGVYKSGLSISNCCIDGVTVTGHSYVGGLYGVIGYTSSGSRTLSSCSVIGNSTITGSGDYVGGLVGSSPYGEYISGSRYYGYKFTNCLLKGTISIRGNNYVGGIVGYSTYGNSSASLSISQCGFEGDIAGNQYVGGIAGMGLVMKSYVKGNVTGSSSYIGGVTGYGQCVDSYHIGNTNGPSTESYIGGISGNDYSDTSYSSYNCYSYGSTSSGYGISYALNSTYRTKNLTSSVYIANSISNEYCNCGPSKTFLSNLSAINSNESYSTQVWKDVDAQCPLLQWQSDVLNGDIDIPGFGNEDW